MCDLPLMVDVISAMWGGIKTRHVLDVKRDGFRYAHLSDWS